METDESGTHQKNAKGDKQDNLRAASDVLRRYAESDRGTDAAPTAAEEAEVLKKGQKKIICSAENYFFIWA